MTEDPERPRETPSENSDGAGTPEEKAMAVPEEEGPSRLLNREITWLAFNGRVLQEAMDPRVPLLERLKFLAIFSSNLDEFFRVRVASLRSLLRLKKKKLRKLDFRPRRLLREIHFIVTSQQESFGSALRSQILPELEANGVFLLNNRNLGPEQELFLKRFFRERVQDLLEPLILEDTEERPFLREGRIYLVAELWPTVDIAFGSERPSYGIVEVPRPPLPRFVVAPGEGHNVLFLEDVIRLSLPAVFPEYEVGSAYAIKLTRDADLYLEDEFEGDLVSKIRKSLEKRDLGTPSRFLYDLQAPYALVSFMKEHLDLDDDDLVPGGRYHNLQDFFQFPKPRALQELEREPLPPLPHPTLQNADSILEAVAERDRILHFPYQSFDYVVRFLQEAARDPGTRKIWITLYRVAKHSAVVRALIDAARNGVEVTAFVEVKARFDEARNLQWAGEMEEAGVRIFYSKPGIKVHSKIALITRAEEEGLKDYAFLGTGNFNEVTARVYADHALLTADTRLTRDLDQVFRFLWEEIDEPDCQHLLVAPTQLRSRLTELISAEAANAGNGSIAGMAIKMNSLEDPGMIDLLYDASRAGVRINLIIRGICCMRPGLSGWGENIRARSIVDRFLEHARIFRFVNGGSPLLFLSSADMMKRNLNRRVEVAFPIFDPQVRGELEHFLHLQLSDNAKARVLDPDQVNNYVGRRVGEPRVEAQEGFYHWLEEQLEEQLIASNGSSVEG
ncbi:MAG: polyphosphate kinase 1 [Gemmatimonadota bacterium]|jgi:polyphosphate kinase